MSATATPSETALPDAWSSVTAVWRFNATAAGVNAQLNRSALASGVAALAGAAPADVVISPDSAIPCVAGSAHFPCRSGHALPGAYVVTTIRDGVYAPGRAHALELAAKDAARVGAAFEPLRAAGLVPELEHTSARPNWGEVNRTAYNREFGLYFGLGLGFSLLLLLWVLRARLVGLCRPAKGAVPAAAAAPAPAVHVPSSESGSKEAGEAPAAAHGGAV